MSKSSKRHRYKHVGGKRWIEVRVKSPQQLFDVRDPSPFRERDLDDDFVEYILSATREFAFSTPLKVVIYVEEPESTELSQASILEAIQSYLHYQIELQRKTLKQFVRRGQLFFLIGALILSACLITAQKLETLGQEGLISIFKEGLVIFGWVSMWKPIELILYDWYPLYEKLRLYKKLILTETEIRFASR